jgi:KDO2-lipid IV(A) lauroyltransferase
LRLTLAHDGALWRRLAYAGARYGPDFWVKYSPPLFGVAFALALRPQRQKVRDTLRWVQGETGQLREQRQLFATFIQYACCLTESLAAERPEAANAECRVEGEERLLAALSQGRGALILTAHAGPWDVAARLLRANHGREVVVVMEGEADEDARALHDRVRTRTGVRIVHVGKHPLDALPLVRELKAGTLVAVQLDRGAPSGRGISTQLFDRAGRRPDRTAVRGANRVFPVQSRGFPPDRASAQRRFERTSRSSANSHRRHGRFHRPRPDPVVQFLIPSYCPERS